MVGLGKCLIAVFIFGFIDVEALDKGGVNVCTYQSARGTSTKDKCGWWGWLRCTRHYTKYWTSYKCCPGYHSRDNEHCDYADSCGHPGYIANGYISGSNYSYGSTVNYCCNTNYQLVGSSSRQCQKDGTWSGNSPTCKVINPCYNKPCKNGAVCSNMDSTYNCTCLPGWIGFNCDKANPCPDWNIPQHGAKVCSDWKTEYGRFCLVYCQQNFRLKRGIDHSQWYVCGSNGTLRASVPLPNCTKKARSNIQGKNETLSEFFFDSCHSEASLNKMKSSFLNRVDASLFSFFCRHFRNQCNKDHVSVQCDTI